MTHLEKYLPRRITQVGNQQKNEQILLKCEDFLLFHNCVGF